ncbi:MAG: hypothetical protein WAV90_14910 [Gordonia amarae]
MVKEFVSPFDMEMLDALVGTLDECRAVIRVMSDHFGLNLEGLRQSVDTSREDAAYMFRAASLVYLNAALNESWTDRVSRPHAILARHAEAVQAGAPRVKPLAPMPRYRSEFDEFAGTADDAPSEDSTQLERPKCSAIAKTKGRQCSNAVVALGADLLSHCYGHLEPEERERYDAYKSQEAARLRDQASTADSQLVGLGLSVMEDWHVRFQTRFGPGMELEALHHSAWRRR